MAKEYDDDDINDNARDDSDLPIELDAELKFDEDLDLDDLAKEALEQQLAKKNKIQQNVSRFSLQSRRAIEDHLEKRRLRRELDYLFDDQFVNDDKKPKES